MKDFADQSSLRSKIATLAILIVIGFLTAVLLFRALGEPEMPLWAPIVSLAGFVAIWLGLYKVVDRLNAAGSYVADVILGVSYGVAYMCMNEHFSESAAGNTARFVWLLVFVALGSFYYIKRHPKPE